VLAATGGDVCQEVTDEEDWGSRRLFFPRLDILNAIDEAFAGRPFELVVKQRRPGWLVNKTWAPDGPEGPDNREALAAGSWVHAYCAKRISLAATMNLQAFPFDKQNITFQFQAEDFEALDVRLVANLANLESIVPEADLNGWAITKTFALHSNKTYPSEESFSTVTLVLQVERSSEKILSRYVLGVSFLVRLQGRLAPRARFRSPFTFPPTRPTTQVIMGFFAILLEVSLARPPQNIQRAP